MIGLKRDDSLCGCLSGEMASFFSSIKRFISVVDFKLTAYVNGTCLGYTHDGVRLEDHDDDQSEKGNRAS